MTQDSDDDTTDLPSPSDGDLVHTIEEGEQPLPTAPDLDLRSARAFSERPLRSDKDRDD